MKLDSIQGQGEIISFKGQISGERSQYQWSSGGPSTQHRDYIPNMMQ